MTQESLHTPTISTTTASPSPSPQAPPISSTPSQPPLPLTHEFVKLAHSRIKPHIHETPILTSHNLSTLASTPLAPSTSAPRVRLFFKCEMFQRAGAFKARGAFFSVSRLTEAQRQRGVCSHSSGTIFPFLFLYVTHPFLLFCPCLFLRMSEKGTSGKRMRDTTKEKRLTSRAPLEKRKPCSSPSPSSKDIRHPRPYRDAVQLVAQ